MKNLLAIPLLLGAVGCQSPSKYPSKYEAKDACEDWDNKYYRTYLRGGKSDESDFRN
jgi:hypothetical protein|tara:strand:+ start:107 stop:277 length:171 start_codon:yes stop_codon:yes gene_type:complete